MKFCISTDERRVMLCACLLVVTVALDAAPQEMSADMAQGFRREIAARDKRIDELERKLGILRQALNLSDKEQRTNLLNLVKEVSAKLQEESCARNRLLDVLNKYEPQSWHIPSSFILPGILHLIYSEPARGAVILAIPALGAGYFYSGYYDKVNNYKENTITATSVILISGKAQKSPLVGLYGIRLVFEHERKILRTEAQNAQIGSALLYIAFGIISYFDSRKRFIDPAKEFHQIRTKKCKDTDPSKINSEQISLLAIDKAEERPDENRQTYGKEVSPALFLRYQFYF